MSVFSDPRIIRLLRTRFVPVAINQANERRQQDAEGEFYRKIAGQGPRRDFNLTTQGYYIAAPDGKLFHYSNTHSANFLHQKLVEAANEFTVLLARGAEYQAIEDDDSQDNWNITRPADVATVRVQAQVLGGYDSTEDERLAIRQQAVSRDNLWITADEIRSIVDGAVPESLRQRIARFHLVDNTRGEPPMWRADEIRQCDLTLADGILQGELHLETADGERGYRAKLRGLVTANRFGLTRFDLLVLGEHWGAGRYNPDPPEGKFPLVIAFTLADDKDIADAVPPQATRGNLSAYMQPR